MENKKELRKMISMRKKQVPVEERRRRSVQVMDRLLALPRFRNARNILFYWAMQDEVSTQDTVLRCALEGKNIFLPVVDGDNLRIRRFNGRAALVPGESYSIPEPVEGSEEVGISEIDLVVVPGVAFDADGGRMGRGKGFYDRLLAGTETGENAGKCSQGDMPGLFAGNASSEGGRPYKVGVCFDFQMVDAVPREAHDMLMDAVVCESRTEIVRSDNRVCRTFGIRYPIISGGMVWCSGWELASAVSAAGGLGLLGAGSMKPDLLREHISKCRAATDRPFGVNVPLMSPYASELMDVVLQEKVPAVFTSAGNPKTWTPKLKDAGIKVAHVVSSSKFAVKCAEAGVDAVVAEGFEAGGHNGREETATMVLVPQVRAAVSLPLLAAGGIVSGAGMAAAFALGAEGVQVGTRFAITRESSASEEFKQLCLGLKEGDTMLSLKKVSPTRLIKNDFYAQVQEAEDRGASKEELVELLGRGRARQGIFEGNLSEGELEIGQGVSLIGDLPSAGDIVRSMMADYRRTVSCMEMI